MKNKKIFTEKNKVFVKIIRALANSAPTPTHSHPLLLTPTYLHPPLPTQDIFPLTSMSDKTFFNRPSFGNKATFLWLMDVVKRKVYVFVYIQLEKER